MIALRFRPVLSLVGLLLWAGLAVSSGANTERPPDSPVGAAEPLAAGLDATGLPFEGFAWASASTSAQPVLGRVPSDGAGRGSSGSAANAAAPLSARAPGREALRPAHRAADALARAGAYSAPSTAPPTRHRS